VVCEEHSGVVRSLGNIEGKIDSLIDGQKRLDDRINGTFREIGEHLRDSPEYRGRIVGLETEMRNIRDEKLNSVKASQWRIGIIVGIGTSIVMILLKVFFKV